MEGRAAQNPDCIRPHHVLPSQDLQQRRLACRGAMRPQACQESSSLRQVSWKLASWEGKEY